MVLSILLGVIVLIINCSFVCAEEKIYTDEDLQKYYFKSSLKKTVEEKGRVEVSSRPVSRPVALKVKSPSVVKLRLQGCPTLQDGIDNKGSGSGSAEFKLYTKGRTLQEICDTVGSGCRVCKEIK